MPPEDETPDPRPTVVHEYSGFGRHRIVYDGIPGPWAEYSQLATHSKHIKAATDYWKGILPEGIFLIKSIAYTTKETTDG